MTKQPEILEAGCRHLNLDPAAILAWRLYEDKIVIITERGQKVFALIENIPTPNDKPQPKPTTTRRARPTTRRNAKTTR